MPVTALDPRYPIGEYAPQPFSIPRKVEWLADIKFLPLQLENAVLNLDEAQLHTAYRDGGWTLQQVIHHVADSHINAYCRFKLALTEDNPTIKPYVEDLWVKTQENEILPISVSLQIIAAMHLKLVTTDILET